MAENPQRGTHKAGSCPDCRLAKPPALLTLNDISAEVIRARLKFPGNRFLLAALTEEAGELAQAMLQKRDREAIRKEAIQVACVAIRILEEGDSSFDDITEEESKA